MSRPAKGFPPATCFGSVVEEPRLAEGYTGFYRGAVRRIVGTLVLTGSTVADASDLAADAFVRAWERWDRVGRMDRPDQWVLTVAMNLRRRRFRRRGREAPYPLADLPAASAAAEERDLALLGLVAELPERQRAAIVLRYFADLTEPQCAAVLGVRVGTVAASLTHARRSLGRALADLTDGAAAQNVGEEA